MKGSLFDIAGIIVTVFALIVFSFVMYSVNSYNTMALSNLTVAAGANATIMNQIIDDSTASQEVLISAVPVITIAMALSSLVAAFFIPASPVLFFLSFLLLVMYEILAAMFANILFDFITSSFFIDIANSHPLVVLLVEKLPWVVGVIWFLMVIVIYANPNNGNSPASGWG